MDYDDIFWKRRRARAGFCGAFFASLCIAGSLPAGVGRTVFCGIFAGALFCGVFVREAFCQIDGIWITQSSQSPDRVSINWHSVKKGGAVLNIGTDKNSLKQIVVRYDEPQNFHSVEADISKRDAQYFYSVETDGQKSEVYSFKSYPSAEKELRVASVGNWGYSSPKNDVLLKNLLKNSPHLLVSCGDNIPALHRDGGPVKYDDTSAYLKLIARCPELFRSVIFLSVPGNHDKEFRARGKTRPDSSNPVYDLNATAFTKFFKFPAPGWRWQFCIPEHGVKFLGLDLCHISDVGTGWQACHAFDANSEQFKWYKKVLSESSEKYIVTFYNEQNAHMRRVEKGIWAKEFAKVSLCISGFGYFMEFAKPEGLAPFINNSLNPGAHYKDKANALWSEPVGGFTLLRFIPGGRLQVELRDLKTGNILYSEDIPEREFFY